MKTTKHFVNNMKSLWLLKYVLRQVPLYLES
jgi:hypothetical protein